MSLSRNHLWACLLASIEDSPKAFANLDQALKHLGDVVANGLATIRQALDAGELEETDSAAAFRSVVPAWSSPKEGSVKPKRTRKRLQKSKAPPAPVVQDVEVSQAADIPAIAVQTLAEPEAIEQRAVPDEVFDPVIPRVPKAVTENLIVARQERRFEILHELVSHVPTQTTKEMAERILLTIREGTVEFYRRAHEYRSALPEHDQALYDELAFDYMVDRSSTPRVLRQDGASWMAKVQRGDS